MIVVIGSPVGQRLDTGVAASGIAARAALAAAAAGRSVQMVGRTGDDPAAEALMLSLASGGVGHVALLRDPARPTAMEPQPPSEEGDPLMPDEPGLPGPEAPEVPEPPGAPEGAPLDAADVELGLRYLTEFRVIVLAESAGPDVVAVVAEATRWNGAQLLVVVAAGTEPADGLPPEAIVFEAPVDDRDGVFATLVGTFAAALDDGADPAEAFRASIAAEGWTEATPGEDDV